MEAVGMAIGSRRAPGVIDLTEGDHGMKGKRLAGSVLLGFSLFALLAAGCAPDPKERITRLEENNQALTDELNARQNELVNLRGENDACQQELANARSEAASLRDQLATRTQAPAPEGWTSVPGGAMIAIEGWALFDSGKAEIQNQSKPLLDQVVSTVQSQYPTKDVMVFGHTDDQPIKVSGWKDNWELSAQRALSVGRYMASRGITPKRLVACGCGEFRPRAPNESERARQKNRRVEIFVLDPQPRTGSK